MTNSIEGSEELERSQLMNNGEIMGEKSPEVQVHLKRCAIGFIQAPDVTVDDGKILLAKTNNLSVSGQMGTVVGDTIFLENNRTGLMIGRQIQGQEIHSVVMLAGQVEGTVHTILDTRTAAIFGIFAGAILGIIIGLFRFSKNR